MATVPEIVTTLELSNPVTLTGLLHKVAPAPSYLYDTLVTLAPEDIVRTDDVLVDVKDHKGNRLAPFVVKGHKSMERAGFQTFHITPSRIAPQMPITLNDTRKRMFLEQIADPDTQEMRAMKMAKDDMTLLVESTRNSYELLISQLIQGGKYTYKNVKSDKGDGEEEEQTVDFTQILGADNIKVEPETTWDQPTADPLNDMRAMAALMRAQGVTPTTLLVGSEVVSKIYNNATISKLLDNRRMELGKIQEETVAQGGAVIGELIVDGLPIRIVQYAGTYVDDEGTTKPFIDPKKAILTRPGSVRAWFSGVTQIDQGSTFFRTYLDAIVPKFKADDDLDEFTMKLTSRPVFGPAYLGAFVTCDVLAAE